MRIATPEAKFIRPADTTAYADGDLVANDTDIADVVPLKFTVGGQNVGIMIRRARLRTSTTNVTLASFRLHLFTNKPTPAVADNAALVVSDTPGYLGYFDFTLSAAFADGAVVHAVPAIGSEIVARVGDGAIYGLLQAKAGYTPASAQLFYVQLEVLLD